MRSLKQELLLESQEVKENQRVHIYISELKETERAPILSPSLPT